MLASVLVTGRVVAQEGVSFIAGRVILTGGNPMSLAGGDFDGDRLPDLAVATLSTSGPSPIGEVTVWRGQGDATFAALPPVVAGISPRAVDVGDVNADGQLDVAVATSSPNGLIMLLGRGDGSFQATPPVLVSGSPAAPVVGDFNEDGRLDVAVARQAANAVAILLGQGDGSFQALPPAVVGSGQSALAVGDFDSDGWPDLAVVNESSDMVTIRLNNTPGFAVATAHLR
jgi:hypothetical protein